MEPAPHMKKMAHIYNTILYLLVASDVLFLLMYSLDHYVDRNEVVGILLLPMLVELRSFELPTASRPKHPPRRQVCYRSIER